MPEALDALTGLLASVAAKSKEKRGQRIAKNTPESWRKVWIDALRAHYPECVVDYTDRAANNLKQAISRGLPLGDMLTFLPWVVENWAALRSSVFSANPRKPYGPDAPDMEFFVKFIGKAHAVFMRSKPEIAAALPLAARRLHAAPAPAIPPPAPLNKRPTASPAPLNRMPIARPKPVSAADAEAIRAKFNLPKFR